MAVAAQLTIQQRKEGGGLLLLCRGRADLSWAKNLRAAAAESCLLGKDVTRETIADAAAAAAAECSPTDDPLRGSAEYKREMAAVFTGRALALAIRRAQGK